MYWFGDCTKSVIDIKDIVPITKFPEVYQPSKKGIYRVALYDFLSDAAESCNYTEVNAPDCVNIDDTALNRLIKWALEGFIPGGPPNEWAPTDHYHSREKSTFMKRVDLASGSGDMEVCVACQERESSQPHPLFENLQLCDSCLEDFSQCAFLFGEDGTGLYNLLEHCIQSSVSAIICTYYNLLYCSFPNLVKIRVNFAVQLAKFNLCKLIH